VLRPNVLAVNGVEVQQERFAKDRRGETTDNGIASIEKEFMT